MLANMISEAFGEWFARLQVLANESRWELGDPESYQEYYHDGDSPEEALAEEMSYAEDDDDGNGSCVEDVAHAN